MLADAPTACPTLRCPSCPLSSMADTLTRDLRDHRLGSTLTVLRNAEMKTRMLCQGLGLATARLRSSTVQEGGIESR